MGQFGEKRKCKSSKLAKLSGANQAAIMSIPLDPEERKDTQSEVAQNWKKEIVRRIEELESGKVKGVPLEDSLSRARESAGL
jgi:putative addiction module component (TIGR02574 family)